MRKKLTITIDSEVYDALHRQVRRGHISRYIETLLREYLFGDELAFYIADPAVENTQSVYIVAGRALKDLELGNVLYVSHSDVNVKDAGYIITNIEGYGQTLTSVRAAHSCALTLRGEDIRQLHNTRHLYMRVSGDK
jgi:hypothetical protein